MPETRISEWQDFGHLLRDLRRHVDATGERVVSISGEPEMKRDRLVGWRSVPRNPEDGAEEWHCDIEKMKDFLADARVRVQEVRERRMRSKFLGLLEWRRAHPPRRKSQWERLLDWVP
jgi:hypothetical protein